MGVVEAAEVDGRGSVAIEVADVRGSGLSAIVHVMYDANDENK